MIKSKDRSYFIGASDTEYVVSNWNTKTFDKWYGTKMGIYSSDFTNEYMRAGTVFEHRILECLNIPDLCLDTQLISGRLRVNLDGNTSTTIYEVKTHKNENGFKVTKAYRNQVYVQMYAFGIREAYIVSYALTEHDYKNYYRDIEKERIGIHKIEYNEAFIKEIYLPRFTRLCECLDKGEWAKFTN